MIIKQNIDQSKLREHSEKMGVPIVELLLKKLDHLSKKENIKYTLFAACPNSYNVMVAALRSAKRANAPIKFAATLNQVDLDGGYTNWTQLDLIRKIKEESYRIGYTGPVIVAIDHGGPWAKDIQTIEKWDLDRSMDWIKKSFKASLSAGYDLIHVDPTIDIFKKSIEIETVVERTIELIVETENYRKKNGLPRISYEVGTEEVHGGLADIEIFKKFLHLLKEGLKEKNMEYAWPVFIVAKVGTDLHTTSFDPLVASEVVEIARNHNSYIKGHYTDSVSNPEDYPKSGIGGANVGPEFTITEFEAFNELTEIEAGLFKEDKIACLSNFKEELISAVVNSGRWKKWLLDGEKDFKSLTVERKRWILGTCSRYVWANPEIKCAEAALHNNLQLNGIDSKNWVLLKIEAAMDKYFRAFNLVNINEKIDKLLDKNE
ncbi:MAG: class II D-tagatose-bisphosphate aldolase, non-catalytic subunit [Actinobacteria bacterium]|nr:class II D-tagatose-bisphosphate aldolase, non-catalytic subunit [Actinomycetota bacterium]